MEQAVTLDIPLEVEVSEAGNWYEVKQGNKGEFRKSSESIKKIIDTINIYFYLIFCFISFIRLGKQDNENSISTRIC